MFLSFCHVDSRHWTYLNTCINFKGDMCVCCCYHHIPRNARFFGISIYCVQKNNVRDKGVIRMIRFSSSLSVHLHSYFCNCFRQALSCVMSCPLALLALRITGRTLLYRVGVFSTSTHVGICTMTRSTLAFLLEGSPVWMGTHGSLLILYN